MTGWKGVCNVLGFRIYPAVLLCFAAASLYAAPPKLELSGDGVIDAGEVRFTAAIFDAKWRFHGLESSAFQRRELRRGPEVAEFTAAVELPGVPAGQFRQRTRVSAPGVLEYRAEFRFPSPAQLNGIVLAAASLPAERFGGREIVVDGRRIGFPRLRQPKEKAAFFSGEVRELEIPLEQGVLAIRGGFRLLLQDDRPFGRESYSMRISFTPASGKISASELQLSIAAREYRSYPLDLSGAANAGFTDEIPGDRKGGWTDQGAENDLSALPAGVQRWKGIDFSIPDSSAGGNACVMLAGKNRMYFARSASAEQPRPVSGKYLYLLHATAWAPGNTHTGIGTVELTYADGASTRISVTSADVGDWWNPVSRENGDVVWAKNNRSATTGLYRSAYPIEPKPVKSIRFESAQASPWGIVAATVSSDPAIRAVEAPFFIVENREWQPIALPDRIEPGSVLDFSPRLDAPAGKYGPPVIREGKIVFEGRPDRPVRFFGVNLSRTIQFRGKAESEALADYLAACGYNAVRIHHHDAYMVRRENGRSTELDPVQMDKLDYLIHCLKRRGIYILTDLYVSRHLETGEIPELPGKRIWQENFKPLLFVLDSVMANWKRFSENWLNHVNPYTGFALKDEPALLSVSLVNEDTISAYWNREPAVAELFERRFGEWKKKRGIRGGAATIQDPVFSAFLRELYDEKFLEMKEFVRGAGLKCMISDQNFLSSPGLTAMRDRYDFVENHFYWDHPSFLGGWWSYPAGHHNLSPVSRFAAAPGVLFSSRIFGKPFLVTEFDFAAPNAFRAEGPVLTGAYAALQDWDGLFQFVHFNPEKGNIDYGKAFHFDSSTDPVKMLSLRIARALFLDRGVTPAERKFALLRTGKEEIALGESDPEAFNRLGLMVQVGNWFPPENGAGAVPAGTAAAVVLRPGAGKGSGVPCFAPDGKLLENLIREKLLESGQYDPAAERFRSASGNVSLDRKRGIFEAVSPGCEAVILPPGNSGGSGVLRVENRAGHGVFAAMAADGRTLQDSGRILILHLTDVLPAGTRFAGRGRTRLEAWGNFPLLAARGEAEISFQAGAGSPEFRLYAVDLSGKRIGEVPLERDDRGMVRFGAKVFSSAGTVFAYELVREPDKQN